MSTEIATCFVPARVLTTMTESINATIGIMEGAESCLFWN